MVSKYERKPWCCGRFLAGTGAGCKCVFRILQLLKPLQQIAKTCQIPLLILETQARLFISGQMVFFCSRNVRNKCGQLKHFRGSQNALGTSTIGKIAELLKAGRGI